MTNYRLLIDGQAMATQDQSPVIDPSTGHVFAYAPLAGEAELHEAVAAARRAFSGWASDEAKRRAVLAAAAERLQEHAQDIAALITREQGRPIGDALGEVLYGSAILRSYAGFRVEEEVLLDAPGHNVRVVAAPLGVVAAITPWNVPILLLLRDIAPALLAGNTVVAKPSEYTPLSTLTLAGILADIFPEGVLNVLAGGKELGAALTRHPGVNKVTFTGSVATGKAIVEQTAHDLKRVSLELGGNDPAIVLADAAVDPVADGIFASAFANTGQICFAIKRVYVARPLFLPLIEALVERAKSVRIGPGENPETNFGPLSNKQQFDRIIALLEDAVKQGATIHHGGQPLPGDGYFYPPTIVSGIGKGVALVDEEQFGPALPIIPFDDEDEAIALANDSPFGLGASVWTADHVRGASLVRRLDAGYGWVNQHGRPFPGAPGGGHKWSGIGYRGGLIGYNEYVALQAVDVVPLKQ